MLKPEGRNTVPVAVATGDVVVIPIKASILLPLDVTAV
jgi:hypothetical protein